MKVSYNWLKDYIDCSLSPKEIADAMTAIGIEVDSVEEQQAVEGGLAGVVVAKVLTCEPHPDSDHLHVTTVDDGTGEPLTVVCGAPNVAAGQKVLFARIGALLPGGFKIKKSKLRGVESFGMICAEDELGIGTDHSGIKILPENASVGTPAAEYLQLKSEAVIEYEITANRPDAASHWGVARDLYAYLKLRGIPCELKFPSVEAYKEGPEGLCTGGEEIDGALGVDVEDPSAAPLYTGITIKDVKICPSPEWLQKKLLSIGLHPINNVVDVSNFVLFELGEPLHTFDADKVHGGKVIVRRALEGEKLTTLDGIERTLSATDIVIADDTKALCLAGIFGGAESGITDQTKDVFIEGAYFDPGSIRKTSKRQQLQTDASYRFERGADPSMAAIAGKRCAELIIETGGGHLVGSQQTFCPKPVEKKVIDLNYDRIERLIGKKIGHETIKNILTLLQYDFLKEEGSDLTVAAPTYMVDVERECDVVEEVLRIYGYNNIELPAEMKMSINTTPYPDAEAVRNYISNFFAALGFTETMNNSLTKGAYYDELKTFPAERCVRIVNPLSSDLNVMRQTLILNGLEVIAYNLNRQIHDLKTFEYGSVYQRLPEGDGTTLKSYEEHQCFTLFITGSETEGWRYEPKKGSYFALKGYFELLLKRYGADPYQMETEPAPQDIFSEGLTYRLPGSHEFLANLGTVAPVLVAKFDVRQPVFACEIAWPALFELVKRVKVKFEEMPRFPEVRRDLAIVLDESVSYAEIHKAAFKTAKKILRQLTLFDVYRGEKIGEGKKQYALGFVFQDPEKTLTDEIIEKLMAKLLSTFQNQFGAVLR